MPAVCGWSSAPQAGQQLNPRATDAKRPWLAWSADQTNPSDTYPFAPPVKLHAARWSDGTT
jgi:hypothetical protein